MSANAPLPGAFDVFARAHAQRPERPKRPETGGPASHATLRDYFAARAPEVPEWFEPFAGNEPSIPPRLDRAQAMPKVPGFAALSQDHRNYLMGWATDGGDHWDPPDDMEVFTEAAWALIEQRENEIREAKQRLAAQRFFRWRWYYADQMLAGRSA